MQSLPSFAWERVRIRRPLSAIFNDYGDASIYIICLRVHLQIISYLSSICFSGSFLMLSVSAFSCFMKFDNYVDSLIVSVFGEDVGDYWPRLPLLNCFMESSASPSVEIASALSFLTSFDNLFISIFTHQVLSSRHLLRFDGTPLPSLPESFLSVLSLAIPGWFGFLYSVVFVLPAHCYASRLLLHHLKILDQASWPLSFSSPSNFLMHFLLSCYATVVVYGACDLAVEAQLWWRKVLKGYRRKSLLFEVEGFEGIHYIDNRDKAKAD